MIEINREHPDYKRQQPILRGFRDLYSGGYQFKQRASEYLMRRQKEGLDVYAERLQRVFYQNYVGSIIDWYASTLFRREPAVRFDKGPEQGQLFLSEFIEDCDRKGTKLSHFFRACLIEMLIAGKSHILIDFPLPVERPLNRAEEDAAGVSRAYLVKYQAEDLTNWSVDENGNYEWVVLRQDMQRQPSVDSSEVVDETFWRYYDKSEYRIYRQTEHEGKRSNPILIAQGPHAFTREQKVPLITMQVSEGLWLMNKAASLQLVSCPNDNVIGGRASHLYETVSRVVGAERGTENGVGAVGAIANAAGRRRVSGSPDTGFGRWMELQPDQGKVADHRADDIALEAALPAARNRRSRSAS